MIRDDCCSHDADGTYHIVEDVEFCAGEGGFECEDCGYEFDGWCAWLPSNAIVQSPLNGWLPRHWLKRIDPPALTETERTDEGITA